MPADVVHGVDVPILAPRNDDVVFTNLEQLIIARVRDFAHMKRVNPTFENEMGQFSLMHQMRAIEVRVHRMMRALFFLFELCAQSLERIIDLCVDQMHEVSLATTSAKALAPPLAILLARDLNDLELAQRSGQPEH